MRKLNVGANDNTAVFAVDEKGPGGANHVYEIISLEKPIGLCKVDFQKGPIKESGINGIQNEDLLAIVIDRLQGFQKGDFACKENSRALLDLYGALINLQKRTKKREKRGVEGTNQV